MESIDLFARKCSITGKGINQGYVIGDGEMYIDTTDDLTKHIYENTHYSSIQQAYNDEYYYFTDWNDDLINPGELNEAYNSDGELYRFIDNNWVKHEYPFQEGDTYFTIEEDQIVESCWDDFSEKLFDENPKRIYFPSRQEANSFMNTQFKRNRDLSRLFNTTIIGLNVIFGQINKTDIEIVRSISKEILLKIDNDYFKLLFKNFVLEKYNVKI